MHETDRDRILDALNGPLVDIPARLLTVVGRIIDDTDRRAYEAGYADGKIEADQREYQRGRHEALRDLNHMQHVQAQTAIGRQAATRRPL